jgi:hypothetical protein
MVTLKTIEDYFKDYTFSDSEVVINEAEKITNLKTFINTHISMLKANPGNPVYLPYYERLKKVYLITKI